ncbi:DUF916 and DUF3324 domain-containing protein [Enterococcus sp. AZ126]|uniref:DUF916 and DUF3324 domain-containing protein n=1 Tax=Enterococcus sp. AZ126 TaxID=2774635 RepID=UPI003F1FD14D
MKTKYIWCTFFFLLLFFFTQGIQVSEASEHEGFYVKAIFPENQREAINTYYDLVVEPNHTQKVQLSIVNNTKEFKQFSVSAENCYTNDDISIGYGNSKKYDPTLTVKLTDLVTVPATVDLDSHQTKLITFTIKTPEKPFKGIVLGGIRVTENSKEKKATSGVTNLFSYVLPIEMRMNEGPVKQELVFKEILVKKNEYTTELRASLQNPQPTLLSELAVTTKVFKEKEQKPLVERIVKNRQVAPNTSFYPVIYLDKNVLSPGKYRVEISVNGKQLSETWEQTITLKKDEVKALSKGFHIKNSTTMFGGNLLFYILGLFILFMSLLLWKRNVILTIPKRKKKKRK